MSNEIVDAFEKIIDRDLLNVAYRPLSSYIENNFSRIDLTYRANFVQNVENATLLDFELIKLDGIEQDDDKITFKAVVNAEIEIEETIQRDREVESVQKWFVLKCSVDIDNIPSSFVIKAIDVY